MWVDIGRKSEALVPIEEMRSRLQEPPALGEEVLLLVTQPLGQDSHFMLSLDRAQKFQSWHHLERCLETGEVVEAEVTASNRGGLVVRCEGLQGFVPLSHLSERRSHSDWPKEMVGGKLKLRVIEINQHQHKLILSQKVVTEAEKERLLAQLREGEMCHGRVSGVHSFGLFVDLGGVEGLVPASEVSWERGDKNQQEIEVGQAVEVYIMKVDHEAKKLVLSLKRAGPHPWEKVGERFQAGQMVEGEIVRLFPFGALVSLDGGIFGLAHISELASQRVNHPKEVVKPGERHFFLILSIDQDKRHLRLSLKQAREEGQNGQGIR